MGQHELDAMTKIININKNVTDFLKEAEAIQNELDRSMKDTGHVGFVYLLKIDEKIYKIGMTQNLDFRFGQLHLNKLKKGIKDFFILFIIETNAPKQLEGRLRQILKLKKVSGQKDHFYLDTDDIELIKTIAIDEIFKDEYPKPKKIIARPGSIEDFLNKIFKRKYDLIAVAHALAGRRDGPFTITEINEMMTPIKYDNEDIARAIRRLKLDYKFINEHNERFELNKYFWDKFATKEYFLTIGIRANVAKRRDTSCGMDILIRNSV